MTEPEPGGAGSTRHTGWLWGSRIIVGVIGLVIALLASGRWPGLTSSVIADLSSDAAITCQAHHLFSATCPEVGLPAGQANANGLAATLIAGALAALPLIGAQAATLLFAAAAFALSLWGTMSLAQRLGCGPILGLAAGAVYTISPTIIGLNGFGATQWGFVLLPTFIELTLRFFERWVTQSWPIRGALLLGWSAVSSIALLTDGYTFVVSATISGLVLLSWTGWRHRNLAGGTALLAFAASSAIAVGVYHRLVGAGTDLTRSPQGLFRAMGLDVTSLYRPSGLWWLGKHDRATELASLWGDSSNSLWNYVGFGCAALAVVGLVLNRRRILVLPLLLALAVTGILALGPSLKVDDHRPAPVAGRAENLYDMPESAAQASLPTSILYERAPGIDTMRATYRWFGGSRLILILLAASAVGALTRRRDSRTTTQLLRVTAVLVAIAAALELVPNPHTLSARYRGNHEVKERVNALAAELGGAVGEHQRVAFVSLRIGTFPNDYLIPYMTQRAGLQTTNVAGDKQVKVLLRRWPVPIRNLMIGTDIDASTVQALSSGLVDAVVIPRFDVRYTSAQWESDPAAIARARAIQGNLATDQQLSLSVTGHFVIVRSAAR